jgi:hypothetical protein
MKLSSSFVVDLLVKSSSMLGNLRSHQPYILLVKTWIEDTAGDDRRGHRLTGKKGNLGKQLLNLR